VHSQSAPTGRAAQRLWRLRSSQLRLTVAGLVTVAWPLFAWAHEETGQAAGFLAGLNHPVSGLDHVLAMVAVGFWGAQLGAPALWALPVAFPMVMAVGGMLGLMGIPIPGVELGIALSAVALGAMVLGAVKPALPVAAGLVGFFAIFHGHAHGTELPDGASGLYYSIGFVIATGLLHAAGIGFGMIHSRPHGPAILRAAGGLVMVAGFYFLWQALA
jgi:urease accessory protein